MSKCLNDALSKSGASKQVQKDFSAMLPFVFEGLLRFGPPLGEDAFAEGAEFGSTETRWMIFRMSLRMTKAHVALSSFNLLAIAFDSFVLLVCRAALSRSNFRVRQIRRSTWMLCLALT